MNRHPAARDLGLHLQRQIGELLERQIGVARQVLEPSDLTIMLIEAAVSISLTAAATAAASVDDQVRTGEFFDFTQKSIFDLARADRERSLAKVDDCRARAAA